MTVLACDMGGTRIKAALVAEGRVLARTITAALSERPMRECLASLAAVFRGLFLRKGIEPGACAGIAMSFPSLVNPAAGRVLDAFGKYRDAPETDLPGWAQREFGLPLAIENDARMALAGEWRHGAGRGSENLVLITLGTGIGTAAILEGKVVRGIHGQASILGGHSTVHYGGRACSCGNLGCAEAEASLTVAREIAAGRPDTGAGGPRAEPISDYEALFQRARQGDPGARAAVARSIEVWGAVAVNLIHNFDPERVILGGGIMRSADIILPLIRDYVARHAKTPWGQLAVVPSQLGDDAAILASEWLLEERLRTRS